MKIKRILALILCLTVLFAMSALTSCKKDEETTLSAEEKYNKMSPEQKFSTSLIKAGETVGNWEGVAEITKVISTAAQTGSIQLQLDYNGVQLDAKIWADGVKYALKADANNGSDQLSLNTYFDPEKEVVLESEQLGGAYGINMKTLLSDLSALAAEEGNQDLLDSMTEAYNEYMKIIGNLPEVFDHASDIAAQERDDLLKSIIDNTTISSESKKVTSMDQEIDATCITLRIDNESAAKMIEAFAESIKNNAEFADYIDELESLLAIFGEISDDETFDDETFENDTFGDETFGDETFGDGTANEGTPNNVSAKLFDKLKQGVEGLVNEIKEAEPFEVNVVLSTDSVGSIVRVDVDLKIGKMPVKVSLEYAEDNKEFGGLRLTVAAEPQEGVSVTVVLNISVEKTAEGKTINFNTTGLGTIIGFDVSGSIKYNKETGATAIHAEISDGDNTSPIDLGFTYKISDETFVFGNVTLNFSGMDLPIPNFLLTIKEKDTMPSAPKDYQNILQMNNEELGQFGDAVKEAIGPFVMMFAR